MVSCSHGPYAMTSLVKKKLLHIDLLGSLGAGLYAALVAGVEQLAYLGEVFATPKAAAAFALVALGRWYASAGESD